MQQIKLVNILNSTTLRKPNLDQQQEKKLKQKIKTINILHAKTVILKPIFFPSQINNQQNCHS